MSRERRLPPTCVILILSLALAACASSVEVCGRAVQELDVDVSAVAGPDLVTGVTIAISDFAGKTVLVNTWGSWCVPCRTEQPELQETWETLSAARDDIVFLGLNVRDDTAAALAFQEEFGVTYPSIVDDTNAVAAAFGVTVSPTTLVIDFDGILRYVHVGQISGTAAGCLVTAVADAGE